MATVFAPLPPVLAATTTGDDFPVRRVFCIGQNYAAHAAEMGAAPAVGAERAPPFFFTKWAEAVVPTGSTIAYPQGTADYHFEAELVVAIGVAGRDILAAEALDHVWGYGCGLDMTRRDLQGQAKAKGRPWDAGKNVEQSAPLGPLTPAAGFDPTTGTIQLTVDGAVRQTGDLGEQIWAVADLIAFISTLYTLQPGDLIYTGTPSGVGPVSVGERLVVTIDGLTPLEVTVGPPTA
ncbi:fumarylacetoacetate hydrolase family protein [soil metagenome]